MKNYNMKYIYICNSLYYFFIKNNKLSLYKLSLYYYYRQRFKQQKRIYIYFENKLLVQDIYSLLFFKIIFKYSKI